MQLKILTPERIVLEESVEAVYAVTEDGEIGILPRHVPLVTPMSIGVLRYVKEGQKTPVAVMGGVLHTDGEKVSILSDSAELASEIDAVRAQHAKERAEAEIRQQASQRDAQEAEAALARSLARLKATEILGQ
jgi:F-type H+-transporting ATPase subunit epsilon